METKHVAGKKKGHIMLYALSTCVWCKKTKRLLNELGIEYDYVDVDLLASEDRDKVKEEVLKWNSNGSYPTIVIDNTQGIAGYDPDKIKKVLGDGQ
ncbi:glutaredoxin [candidate division WOR_3 bacterium SM23_42]|uniref:Glutaredoxin n=1 Tax=candidate division WOR_3 bacterium SM23_42 TaxID=1703779 RepID=A0A0S8FVV0_UNCW3|nr:MAG: glutaredoxin [candidate division WOR_3 bacterium SM23_42]